MNDPNVVKKVINVLGAVVVISVVGLIWLINANVSAEQLTPLVAIATGSLGGLTGILASTHTAPGGE